MGADVLACPRIGGRLRLIALIKEVDHRSDSPHLGFPEDLLIGRRYRAPPVFAAVGEAQADEYESAP